MIGEIQMIVIICVDDNYGTMFNNRRQSRDKTLIEKILQLTKGKRLWIGEYSKELFYGKTNDLNIDNDCFSKAMDGEYCFVENGQLKPFEKRIEKIIIFKWNREYPSDVKLDINLDNWNFSDTEDFVGNSHGKITMEVYIK